MDARLHIVVPLGRVHKIDEAVLVRRKRTGRAVSRNATINELLDYALAAEEQQSIGGAEISGEIVELT